MQGCTEGYLRLKLHTDELAFNGSCMTIQDLRVKTVCRWANASGSTCFRAL